MSYSRLYFKELRYLTHSLDPPEADYQMSYSRFFIKELWAEQGSNLRTRERTDLQSVAFNRSAICPIHFTLSHFEPVEGFEPPTS